MVSARLTLNVPHVYSEDRHVCQLSKSMRAVKGGRLKEARKQCMIDCNSEDVIIALTGEIGKAGQKWIECVGYK